jgi:hypothetical protein
MGGQNWKSANTTIKGATTIAAGTLLNAGAGAHHLASARRRRRMVSEAGKQLISGDRLKLEFAAEKDDRIRAFGTFADETGATWRADQLLAWREGRVELAIELRPDALPDAVDGSATPDPLPEVAGTHFEAVAA